MLKVHTYCELQQHARRHVSTFSRTWGGRRQKNRQYPRKIPTGRHFAGNAMMSLARMQLWQCTSSANTVIVLPRKNLQWMGFAELASAPFAQGRAYSDTCTWVAHRLGSGIAEDTSYWTRTRQTAWTRKTERKAWFTLASRSMAYFGETAQTRKPPTDCKSPCMMWIRASHLQQLKSCNGSPSVCYLRDKVDDRKRRESTRS